jgi:hypothetical protein
MTPLYLAGKVAAVPTSTLKVEPPKIWPQVSGVSIERQGSTNRPALLFIFTQGGHLCLQAFIDILVLSTGLEHCMAVKEGGELLRTQVLLFKLGYASSRCKVSTKEAALTFGLV